MARYVPQRRREARAMLTPEEIRAHVSPFMGKAWTQRKDARRRRELIKGGYPLPEYLQIKPKKKSLLRRIVG